MSGARVACLPGGEMRTAAWLFGQPGDRRPVQAGRSRTASTSISSGRICRSGALTACGRSTAESRPAGRSRRTSPASGTRRGSTRSGCRRRVAPARRGRTCRTGRRRRRRSARCGCRVGPRPPRRWPRCRRGTCRTTRRARDRRRSGGDRCRRRCARWRGRRTAAMLVKIGLSGGGCWRLAVRDCASASLGTVNSLS